MRSIKMIWRKNKKNTDQVYLTMLNLNEIYSYISKNLFNYKYNNKINI